MSIPAGTVVSIAAPGFANPGPTGTGGIPGTGPFTFSGAGSLTLGWPPAGHSIMTYDGTTATFTTVVPATSPVQATLGPPGDENVTAPNGAQVEIAATDSSGQTVDLTQAPWSRM